MAIVNEKKLISKFADINIISFYYLYIYNICIEGGGDCPGKKNFLPIPSTDNCCLRPFVHALETRKKLVILMECLYICTYVLKYLCAVIKISVSALYSMDEYNYKP